MTIDTKTNKTSFSRRMLYGITNWGLFVAGIVNLGVGTWSAAHDQAVIAATSLTAGLVLLFAATIERFESLKGLGMEAKTRQLDQKIEQADDALHRVRELTELTGATLVELTSKMGRWDSAPGPRDSFALAQKVRSIMSSLGSEPSNINAALRPWARILCHDLAIALVAPLQKAIAEQIHILDRQRQALPNHQTPDFLRLTAEINAGNNYISDHLGKIYQFDLDDYPERFIVLFEKAPLLSSEQIGPIRDKAIHFLADMATLRQTLSLPNSDAWFAEIEEARKARGS